VNEASKIAIVTDSTADIPPEISSALDITVIPVVITMQEETLRDGVDIQRKDFYLRMADLAEPATTAAPSPAIFAETYTKLLSTGFDRILSMHVSQKLSGLIGVASQAAQSFGEKVQIFDSKQVSLGLGFQVMEAARAAYSKSILENVIKKAEEARERVRLLVMVDRLDHLHRSGRAGWLTANLGELLKIKVLVTIKNGIVQRVGQVRTRARALEALLEEARSWGPLDGIGIGHAGIQAKTEGFTSRVRELFSMDPIVFETTPAIGVHVGLGAIAIFGLTK
jgi:DegV family protein with EDD domain